MRSFVTERLMLRGWRPEDAGPLAAMNADPEVMRFSASGPHRPEAALQDAEAAIASWRDGTAGFWAIEDRMDGSFHGWVGLFPLEGGQEIEIGYRLPRSSWGRGIATETARRLLAFGFEERRLDRIVAVTHPENAASQRVLAKLGLLYHDTRPAYGVPNSFYFRLSREAWSARRPS